MMWRLRCVTLAAAAIAIATASAASAETNGERIARILSPAIASCWSIVKPPEGQKPFPFSVSFNLRPDGSVNGRPVSDRAPASDYERMMMDGGVRAVLRCSPYPNLVTSGVPYEDWKEITINFDPSKTDF